MLRKLVAITLVLMLAGCGGQFDTPAGSSPDGPNDPQSCSLIGRINIIPVNYEIERAGIIYNLSAFILDAGCEPKKIDADVMRVTIVVKDGLERRMEPTLDDVKRASPWGTTAFIPNWPGRFSIHMLVEGDLTAEQVAEHDVEYVACTVTGRADTAPGALDLAPLERGHGTAECYVFSDGTVK